MITFDFIYKVLQDEPTGSWTYGRTINRSCFDFKNLDVSDSIEKKTGIYVEAQFWMSKKRKNLNFEFATKNKDHTQLREHLAASLRTFIFAKGSPAWLEKSKGSTVCKVSILDKTDELANTIIKEYFRLIDNAVRNWSQTDLIELLANVRVASKAITKDNGEKMAKDQSITRMAQTALATVNASNGQQVLRTLKNKELRIKVQELKNHIAALVDAQKGFCAISALPLLFDGQEGNKELLCSLDRINSGGHYEVGNLQVVCRFVNRWKNDGDDAEFRRLLGLIRDVGNKTR